jgi:hypothetical protein
MLYPLYLKFKWLLLPLVSVVGLWIGSALAPAQDHPANGKPKLTCAEMEQFLRDAKIGNQRNIPKGVTLPKRATLTSDDGKIVHDASIQIVHESRDSFTSSRGTQLNFKDWWEFNVAGYELAKMLDLNMVPPYVERKVGGKSASLSWWIDDAMMEVDRKHKKLDSPDLDTWNKEMYTLRVFNQLIYNTDDNLTNVLISPDWHLWMIDFTRAFRAHKDLAQVKNLVQCDRRLLAKMKELNKEVLKEKMRRYLAGPEIDGMLARRDKIVKFFEDEVAKKGEAAVLFDLPRVGQSCGVGL